MNIVKLIMLGVIMSAVSVGTVAQDSVVVEWAPYIKSSSVADVELIKIADKVNVEFLSLQKGFKKRELVKKSETEYADIIHWNTQADAASAGAKVESCAVCSEYFKLMDMKASSGAGTGFAYYSILKSW
jgi:hypothetical protein